MSKKLNKLDFSPGISVLFPHPFLEGLSNERIKNFNFVKVDDNWNLEFTKTSDKTKLPFPNPGILTSSIYYFPEINSEGKLIKFMKMQKLYKLPRYNMDNLKTKLRIIKFQIEQASIYDLSKDFFDSREPDCPDIYILLNNTKGLIWFKDAYHLRFNWEEFKVI